MSPFFLLLLIGLTIFGVVWTQSLKQLNKETIFLTAKGQEKYRSFKSDFNIRSLVIGKISSVNAQAIYPLIKKECGEVCEVLDKSSLPVNDTIRLVKGEEEAFILIQNEETSDSQFKLVLKNIIESKEGSLIDFSGVPYTNILLDKYSKKIKSVIFPSLFGGVFLLLLIYLRSLLFAVVVFFPGLMAASFSLVSTKAFLGTSNLITSIIPLLLFVIQMSLVLHIHYTAIELKSLPLAIKDKKEPVFLMVFTTFIGFGSLYFSELEAISDFGIMTAFLLIASTLLSYGWIILLSFSFHRRWEQYVEGKTFPFQKYLQSFWSIKTIMFFSFFSFVIGSIALRRVPIITDATQYFPLETKIREKMISLSENFIGSPLVEILLPSIDEDSPYEKLKELNEIENELKKELPGLILSSNQLVLIGNEAYSGEKTFPSNKFSYFTLRSQIPLTLKEGYPIDQESGYRLTYLGAPLNVDQYEVVLDKIKKVTEGKVQFNGLYYHLMEAQKKMIGTLFKSFFLSLILISLIAFIYFKKLKLFFIFIIVNVIPVFASFPIMYIFGLSFNIATVMTYSISLGLVVDSSFHIIHTLNDPNRDRDFLVKSVLRPIVGASFLLSFCFFLFAVIDFLPIREFGISLGIVILLGMVLDLKVLPSLYP